MINLSSFVQYHARVTPDHSAVIYSDERITYADFARRIESMAAYLATDGITPGEFVAVFMKNSATFLEIAFAVSHVGGVFLLMNFRLAADEVRYIAENAGAKLVFADAEFAEPTKGLMRVIYLDDAAQSDSTSLVPGGLSPPPAAHRTPDDLFRLMYTSGTMDRPKGVMHTYGNFYWKSMEHAVALGITVADRLLMIGPLYHVGAFDLPGVAVLWKGGSVCILRNFDPAAALALIERERLTGTWGAPVMMMQMLGAAQQKGIIYRSDETSLLESQESSSTTGCKIFLGDYPLYATG